jgi:hypothetical protein
MGVKHNRRSARALVYLQSGVNRNRPGMIRAKRSRHKPCQRSARLERPPAPPALGLLGARPSLGLACPAYRPALGSTRRARPLTRPPGTARPGGARAALLVPGDTAPSCAKNGGVSTHDGYHGVRANLAFVAVCVWSRVVLSWSAGPAGHRVRAGTYVEFIL